LYIRRGGPLVRHLSKKVTANTAVAWFVIS
jgi:hypothetical protein